MSLNPTTADVMLHLLDGSVCQDLHRKLLFPSSAMDTMGCYLETTYVDYPTSNFCSVRALCSTGMCLSTVCLRGIFSFRVAISTSVDQKSPLNIRVQFAQKRIHKALASSMPKAVAVTTGASGKVNF